MWSKRNSTNWGFLLRPTFLSLFKQLPKFWHNCFPLSSPPCHLCNTHKSPSASVHVYCLKQWSSTCSIFYGISKNWRKYYFVKKIENSGPNLRLITGDPDTKNFRGIKSKKNYISPPLQLLFSGFPSPSRSHVKKKNSMVWVRERTIPTEQPPLVDEVIDNFCV
jgi:hypothetical protein